MNNASLYTMRSVGELYSDLVERGWEPVTLSESVIGLGDFVLVAPDADHYNFVIREVVLNDWSSAYTVRRCAKLSKQLQAEIDAALASMRDAM